MLDYAYTNIKNLTIKYIVILGKFFKKLFFFLEKNPQEYVTNVKIDKIIYSSYTGTLWN